MVDTFSQMMVKLQASHFYCNSLTGKPGTRLPKRDDSVISGTNILMFISVPLQKDGTNYSTSSTSLNKIRLDGNYYTKF